MDAKRVLQGQLPMSDFISYPPGSYFLLAFLFEVFRINLIVSKYLERISMLMNGGHDVLCCEALAPKSWALIPFFIVSLGEWEKNPRL